MNVRSFTADDSSGLDPGIRGSYLGVINKVNIYLLLFIVNDSPLHALYILASYMNTLMHACMDTYMHAYIHMYVCIYIYMSS